MQCICCSIRTLIRKFSWTLLHAYVSNRYIAYILQLDNVFFIFSAEESTPPTTSSATPPTTKTYFSHSPRLTLLSYSLFLIFTDGLLRKVLRGSGCEEHRALWCNKRLGWMTFFLFVTFSFFLALTKDCRPIYYPSYDPPACRSTTSYILPIFCTYGSTCIYVCVQV